MPDPAVGDIDLLLDPSKGVADSPKRSSRFFRVYLIMINGWLALTGVIGAGLGYVILGHMIPKALKAVDSSPVFPGHIRWSLDHPTGVASLGLLATFFGAMAIVVRSFRWFLMLAGLAALALLTYLVVRAFVLTLEPAYTYQEL
jgi:hypothetical protein